MLGLVIAAAVAAAAPGDAPTTVSPANVNGQKAPDPDKVICRSEPVTGSRMNKRICGTQREWDQRGEDARRAIREIQSTATTGIAPPPTGLHLETILGQ